jgi:hypothetical protein
MQSACHDRQQYADYQIAPHHFVNTTMQIDNFSCSASTALLHAMVEIKQRYWLTLIQILNIVELSFLFEHQYSSCLALTYLAFVEHPLVKRFGSVDSLAIPSDLIQVMDEDIESAVFHLHGLVP